MKMGILKMPMRKPLGCLMSLGGPFRLSRLIPNLPKTQKMEEGLKMNYRNIFSRITIIAWSTIAVIFLMCSITLNNAQAKILFEARIDYGIGDSYSSVAIGDLNGDAKPDLTVANYGGNTVSVLLGNGDGTFQSAVNYSAGDGPSSVVIGDLNGDGKLDLAVVNLGYKMHDFGNVSVLLGNGDGSFQSAVNYGAGDHPSSVAIGDLNGDSDLDLAVANGGYGSDTVSVLLGNGDGSFQSAVIYDAGVGPFSIAIGDLNGDGNPDLAVPDVGYGSGTVSVLLGNGDGSFQSAVNYGAGDGPSSVAIGDLNGGAKPDLAVTNSNSGNVSVLLGNGDGSFQIPLHYGASRAPSSVAIGDLNGDGNLDLAVANSGSDNVSILINTGQVIGPAGYTYVADEGESFTFTETVDVAYGANGQFYYMYGVTGTITFDNATFGDPIFGVVKAGFYRSAAPVGPAGYTYVADEGESFTFTETVDVAYGANGQFYYMYGVTGTITFDNATFGDPIFGVVKAGFYKSEDIDLEKGLVASYPFNGNGNDESGNGYNGRIHGDTSLSEDRFGNSDCAYYFDGDGDYIDVGTELNIIEWENYAASVWFLNDGGGDWSSGYGQKVIDKTDWYKDFWLSVDDDDGRLFFCQGSNFKNCIVDVSKDYRDNQWHHVVINNRHGDIELWIDGELFEITYNVPFVLNDKPLLIGYSLSGDSYQRKYWSGKIDDTRIYNRALSEAEIKALYNLGN